MNKPADKHQDSPIVLENINISPSYYAVVLHNDDYTTMDFVIEVLQKFFHFSHEKAVETMLNIHHKGSDICGVYSAEIAETKVHMINNYAKDHQFPLLCTMEKV